jgi:hypothetical protein
VRDQPYVYFQPIARRIRTLRPDELDDLLDEAIAAGALDEEDATEVRRADIVARGRWEDGEVYLVVEVSWTVGLEDVERAVKRAALLRAAGRRAVPVVAGKRVHHEAERACRESGVWQVANDRVQAPPPRAA